MSRHLGIIGLDANFLVCIHCMGVVFPLVSVPLWSSGRSSLWLSTESLPNLEAGGLAAGVASGSP